MINKLCERGQNCTCFVDKIGKYYHGDCCKLHDFNYQKQHITRAKADKKFFNCLRKKTDDIIAFLMYLGVRSFGWIFWNKAKKYKSEFEKMEQKSNEY